MTHSERTRKELQYDESDESDDDTSSRTLSEPTYKFNGASAEVSTSNSGNAAAPLRPRPEASSSRSELSDSDKLPATGYHSIELLDESVNLPEYVREHNTTLTFPEKVSNCRPLPPHSP